MLARQHFIATVTAGCVALALAGATQAQTGDVAERTIQISELPRVVFDAARKALRTAPTDAIVKADNGRQTYEVRGTNVYFKRISVVIAADGTIIKPVDIWEDSDD